MIVVWPRLAGLLGAEPSSRVQDLVAALVQSVAAGTAGVMALMAARRGRPELRRSWTLIGLGLLAWTAGNVAYIVLAWSGPEPGVPSWADLGYAASLPLLAAGVFTWPTDTARRTDVGAALDGLICATAVVLLLWVGFFRTVSVTQTSPVSEIVVSLLYPLVDIIILLVLVVALRRTRPGSRQTLLLITIGLGAVLVADTLYSVTTTGDLTAVPAVLEDAPWVFGYVLIALGTLRSLRHGTPVHDQPAGRRYRSATVDPDTFEDESVSQVATFLAGAGLLAAVVSFAFGDSVDLTTVLMAGTLLVVVMARQAWTLRINTRMTSQLRADIDQLAQQAQRDALTGLPNRVGLDDRIVAASRKATARDRTAAVMFVDLDHLKTVNDSLGHAAGDQLITTMANRLTARVGDRVTRFGGDEFVIVLDDLADEEALDHVAEAVVADGTRTIDLGGIELRHRALPVQGGRPAAQRPVPPPDGRHVPAAHRPGAGAAQGPRPRRVRRLLPARRLARGPPAAGGRVAAPVAPPDPGSGAARRVPG